MDPSPEPYPHLKQLDALVGRGFKASRTWTFPIIVLGVWGVAISTYGWLLGGGLGWIPALVAGSLFSKILKGAIYLTLLAALIVVIVVNRDAIYGYVKPLLIALFWISALVGGRHEILKELRNLQSVTWTLVFAVIGTLLLVYAVMTWGPIPTFLVVTFIGAVAIAGRFFDDHDTAQGPSVVIIDERVAHRFWAGVNPIGRRMYEPSNGPDPSAITEKTVWHTIIGVVGEVKLRGLVEGVGDVGAYHYPQMQRPARNLTFAIRTTGMPSALAGAVRGTIATLDPELPVFDVQTMAERTDRSLVSRRTPVLLAMAFGLVALFLSAIGIYGVLAYLMTQRTKEIGIRMALGGSATAVFKLVLREGVMLIVGGFLLGAGGTMAISRTLERQLFGVRAGDPIVLLLATLTLAVVGLAACALPARRATRISPVIALSE